MLLRKQPQHNVDWETVLTFDPSDTHAEAGTVVWWSQSAYASIGVRKAAGSGRELICTAFDLTTQSFTVSLSFSIPKSLVRRNELSSG
jgi:hypothetical protein